MEPSPHTPRTTPHDEPVRAERHLHLGVLAHVDAGKTSLTEALLLAGGAIDRLGRVDAGTTVTDTLALERRRGITIRAAVATFRAGDVVVNLVDTPGHPDFIAEVERSLAVLDGAVLVVSAVEGVQPQTVVLHRALRRLRVPTVVFVNKTDRSGADPHRVVAEIGARLGLQLVPLDPSEAATEAAIEVLAEHDDQLLARWLEPGGVDAGQRWAALRRLTRAGTVAPLLTGSARTGAGVDELVEAVTGLLTPDRAPADGPTWGQVFKVEHDDAGRRVCTVRLRSGTLAVRDRVWLDAGRSGVVASVRAFSPGGLVTQERARAGTVVQVGGLAQARVGDDLVDRLGEVGHLGPVTAFPPPALVTTVTARDPRQGDVLHRALGQLADVDPLIRLRPDDRSGALRIDVYGEVQREVIAETLADAYGVLADFSPTVAACVERPAGTGHATRRMGEDGHHRAVTLGAAVRPGVAGSGITVVVGTSHLGLPLHVYGTVEALTEALRSYVVDAQLVGPHGWPVTDLEATLTESDYPSGGPSALDVRLTWLEVVTEALLRTGTVVCEPIDRFSLETPTETVAAALGLLLRHRGRPGSSTVRGGTTVVGGTIPSAEVDPVRTGLPTATHGLAVLESTLDHHAPVATGL